jgi:YbbR domain-containing protein
LKTSDFNVSLEPGALDTGEHTFAVTPNDVEYGGDLDIEAVEVLGGGEVQVSVEKTILATVPIVISYDGRPRDGFFLGLPDVSPAKTTIYGPESVVSKVDALRVEVGVSGRDTGVSAVRTLSPPLPGITIVGADEVTVEIDVASGIEKKYNHVPISVMEGDNLIAKTTEPRNADVTLRGHPKRLGAFTRPEVYIDLDETPDANGNYKVRVKAGKQIEVVKTIPLYVAVSDE